MYGHDDGPGDDGASSSSIESARFPNSDIDINTDGEDSEDELGYEVQDEIAEKLGTGIDPDTLPTVTVLSAQFESGDEEDSDFKPETDIDIASPNQPPFYIRSKLGRWIRPDWKGDNVIATSLLRTCRRTYLEVRDKTQILDNAITLRQRDFIRSVHIHEGIKHLRHSTPSPGLQWPEMLDPFGPYRRDDDDFDWEPRMQWCSPSRPWGMFFRDLPRLETFTMDFDATEDRREAVGELVERAVREWRFPLGDDGPFMYLSAEGNPVEKTSWRGPLVIND